MINVEEHVYNDDPKKGHPDVRTYLKDVSYFFLGNGLIQAAVQFSPSNDGSPYGLLIMDPEKLRFKRDSYSMDNISGLKNTMLSIINSNTKEELILENISAGWSHINGVPSAEIWWDSKQLMICERFYCPDNCKTRLIRQIIINNLSDTGIDITLMTGVPEQTINRNKDFVNGVDKLELFLEYSFNVKTGSINLAYIKDGDPEDVAINYWGKIASLNTGWEIPDNFFRMSSFLLPSLISKKGKVDASIWQYNREWVRDHSYMATGLILSGSFDLAEVVLQRLLDDFISVNGSPMDSSEERDYEEVELDQNGILLSTIKTFILWTGRLKFVSNNLNKIELLAEFPIKDIFRHKESGMLYNCRDFWERHDIHGIQPGIEFIHQAMVVTGLKDAAFLVGLLGLKKKASRWIKFADRLKDKVLHDPVYKMIDERGFIKRRNLDGSIQEDIFPVKESGLPVEVPLSQKIKHNLRPDTSCAIPIAIGFVPPDSDEVKNTLDQIEVLWNQDWDFGGHGRYNYTSEADSSGPWPFSSVIVARANMETGNYEDVIRTLYWLDSIPGSLSGSWFEFYGDRISPPYAQIGITPWTWGEIIMLYIQHIAGIFPGEKNITIKPNLLPGMKELILSIPLRDIRLFIDIKCKEDVKETVFKCNSGIIKQDGKEFCINYSEKDIYVTGIIASGD